MKLHLILFLLWAMMICTSSEEFNCPSLPLLAKPATSVHELRPQDIKVVMAMGDSVTAAFAALGEQHDIKDVYEYRGISWSIGGDPNSTTIPSLLKNYNPDLVGASIGSHFAELCYGPLCFPYQYKPEKDVFNAAQSGAMIPDLKKHEFKYLYEQLTKNPKVNLKEDWKLLTILIGYNDLCLGCSDDVPYLTADDFESNLRDILEEVHSKIPRVYVNLIQLFNVTLVHDLAKGRRCKEIHMIFPVECLCIFLEGELGDKLRRDINDLTVQYNDRMIKVAKEFNQKGYDDFAVVAQPGFRDSIVETTPFNFISNVDCFHPSIIAHQAMAKVLWNNMLTPSSKKTTNFDYKAPFVCPTTDTLIYTY